MRSPAGILLSPVGLAPATASVEAFHAAVRAAAGPGGVVEIFGHDGDSRRGRARASRLSSRRRAGRRTEARQLLPTLPSDFTGESMSHEILVSPGGRFVYCSNCGHDSIAIFAADPTTGLLTSTGWVSTQGRTPRFVCFDPTYRYLYAANEQSDTIVAFHADGATGRLTPTGQIIHNPSPVTIAFA